jgi:hypothetical protein
MLALNNFIIMKKNILFLAIPILFFACDTVKKDATQATNILLDTTAIEIYPDSLIDVTVVAGKKFGVLHNKISFDDLQKIFGEKQVKTYRDTVAGKPYATSVLFEGQPNELQIAWHNEELLQYPNIVFFKHPKAIWQADKGIKMGATLEEIEKLNEAPVEVVGFGSRYEGGLVKYKEGKLKDFGKYYNLFLGYDKQENPTVDSVILGENTLESRNAALKNLKLKVVKIQAYLNK